MSPIFAVERLDLTPGRRRRFGGQRAVGGGNPDHHAPIAIEAVLEAEIVPWVLISLSEIRAAGRETARRTCSGDHRNMKRSRPPWSCLRHVDSADVEDAATAGTGARPQLSRSRGQPLQKRPAELRKLKSATITGPKGGRRVRRGKRVFVADGHNNSERVSAPRYGRLRTRKRASDD